jgi:hypothetical protein
MIAILVVLAIASNLCLLAYLAAHIHFPGGSPSPGGRECTPREAGSSQFTPLPLAGLRDGINRPGVRASLLPEVRPHAH